MASQATRLRLQDLPDSVRLLLFRQERILLNAGELFWSPSSAESLDAELSALLHIGESGRNRYLAAELDTEAGVESRSLRSLLFSETDADLELLSKARQLLNWYGTHKFCGICGSATALREGEHILECAACSHQFFPRINPCVIVLVTRGEEVLLARSARFRTGYYSCLAGFVEIGETPEQTIEREVREESGVEVGNIRYVESQSWPFPSQLMLGFLADYRSGDIVPEPGEIEDAAWFHVNNLPPTPSAGVSVAGRLIEGYARSVRDAL
ncbi:MAG: NAD(+) diphosphatase [Gammaproteobacteria bacterium]|nr:NAD(+) diphosphatase [Gammaproteobacteria bacterium]MYE29190.1 NAD(+) diphosphatase [Gammaproteobacteria bacterium]